MGRGVASKESFQNRFRGAASREEPLPKRSLPGPMPVQWAAAQKESLAYLSSEESDVQSTQSRE